MPPFAFTGPGPRVYPESRDASGRHLGVVEPGDVRDLDEAPDQWWAPAADRRPKTAAPGSKETADRGGGQEESDPQPGPPAVAP